MWAPLPRLLAGTQLNVFGPPTSWDAKSLAIPERLSILAIPLKTCRDSGRKRDVFPRHDRHQRPRQGKGVLRRASWHAGRVAGGYRSPPHFLPHQNRHILGLETDRRETGNSRQWRHDWLPREIAARGGCLACDRCREWRHLLRRAARN